jgi:hypothetical protein
VFDDSAARGSAIPTPSEGMVTYLKDTNQVQAYNGAAFAPLGTILQVVSTTKTDTFTMSSTTYATITGLTATITPSSATSKILIFVSSNSAADSGSVTNVFLQMVRDSTPIGIADAASDRTQSSFFGNSTALTQQTRDVSLNFLDSPATTSAITYGVQIKASQAVNSVCFGNRLPYTNAA